MRTTNLKTPNAILTADWHLRDDIPACRTDNFEPAQWRKVKFISDLQETYNCPILHAGDLFDHWKPSPNLLSKAIEFLPKRFYTIFGNHDLPQHNLELAYKCGINVLEKAGKLEIMDDVHWNQLPRNMSSICIGNKTHRTLIWHVMTYQGKKPFPGCTDSPAGGLLRKYPEYDLIVTGHNHQSFTETYQNRLLVNPGSITRQESDQASFQPKVYLYFADTNTVQAVDIPIEKGVVSKPENTQKIEERNKRISAFIEKLNTNWDSTIGFEKNMERYLAVNDTHEEIKKIIYKILDK